VSGSTPELRVRIGIAAGEPVDHNDDLFGSTVTLASRICAAAEARHILTSDVVRDLGRTAGYSFDAGQERTLKGYTLPIHVYELLGTATTDSLHPNATRAD
jgi:class 3 adenylate cyclase